jgi:hypothetical protein
MRWESRGSAVGIATGYWLEDGEVGVLVLVGSIKFSSPRRPDRLWGSRSLFSNGYRGLFPSEGWPVGEADHSLPTSAEVTKT